ncbi:MAG: winged helix-turn-helix domain-containing protein, partial [Azospirillaceae bacterium]
GDADGRQLYRVAFRRAGDDPRLALRETVPGAAELAALRRRLDAIDRRGPDGPWTGAVLRLIDAEAGLPARDMAARLGMTRDPLKRRVRRLKELGLTESLETGYRLSPRGRALLAAFGRDGPD